MVSLRWLLLIGIAWLWPTFGQAQPVPPTPRQLTVFDGLPSNTVNRMAEDGYGYLWIATNDGLARYDGRNYRSGAPRMACATTTCGACMWMPATSCGSAPRMPAWR